MTWPPPSRRRWWRFSPGRLLLAAQELGYRRIVLAGGVSANSGLREYLQKQCDDRGYTLTAPSPIYCTDNAVMVGAQAYHEFLAGHVAGYGVKCLCQPTN